jgi:hypothetical protein
VKELFKNLGQSVGYACVGTLALAFIKLAGPVEYQAGLSWMMVFLPITATYLFVLGVIALVLLGAVVSDKFMGYLTDSEEDGKLDE